MTVALLARGLDPGIGLFHADIDGRSSLALDAIEAVRPYVEYWLFAYPRTARHRDRSWKVKLILKDNLNWDDLYDKLV